MERLAKEKIAAQNRILFLKRELAQWDVDFSKLLPEQNEISAVKSERSGKGCNSSFKTSLVDSIFCSFTDLLNESSYKSGGLIFNHSPSLSGITTPSVNLKDINEKLTLTNSLRPHHFYQQHRHLELQPQILC